MPRNFDNIYPTNSELIKREEVLKETSENENEDGNVRLARFDKNMEKVILNAATEKKQLRIRYQKRTTGETKTYIVCPYSYRYMFNPKGGRQRALFAYDIKDKHIKGFYLKNLKRVEKLNRKFRPIWPIEIF